MDLSDSFDIEKQSGVRGGVEQFNWDSLRSIPRKEREHYLGHSLYYSRSRGKGRFNRNDWYSKVYKSKPDQCISSEFKNERERIINKEQRIMNKLLGIPDNSEGSEHTKNEVSGSDKNPSTIIRESQEMHMISGICIRNKEGIKVNKNQVSKRHRRVKRRSLSRSLSP
ncbi:Multiple myeloma tumor-associated [Cryptosporidium sp. chipmunk genotype I]|uniref:Multiple myeloma tumor-associated n=1 Tax=Cryptosporidium sp. chipmunk genotype I TaxID=1280935 RepID=UPI00351A0A4D|nr:Multiple myeloma tumor-associated [Cryptosporidium sp. chipmunk genotype I]